MWLNFSGIVMAVALAAPGQIGGNPQDEMKELFRLIEKDMKDIDRLLLEAGARPAKEKIEGVQKKLDELLKQTLERQKQVSRNIEEILKKIPPDGNQGQGQQPPPDQKNQDPSGEREREKTPLDPGQITPKEPEPSQPEQKSGKNKKALPPHRPPPDPANQANSSGKWGELPPLYQELFRNDKTDEMPVRYRKWIEDYYRRVNEAKRP